MCSLWGYLSLLKYEVERLSGGVTFGIRNTLGTLRAPPRSYCVVSQGSQLSYREVSPPHGLGSVVDLSEITVYTQYLSSVLQGEMGLILAKCLFYAYSFSLIKYTRVRYNMNKWNYHTRRNIIFDLPKKTRNRRN